ncbi:glycosyltransferase family 4 protein, partial [Candidatus Micrarchaeota archaeon]|nr:glycosyltransferase family 4 protein [Candidatus Micrarchaeota archaeon]
IIPNEIDISRFEEQKKSKQEVRQELGINTTDPIVLFVHRLSKRKGTLNLPPIIENTNKQVKNAKFIIAGDGPNRKDLEDELEKRQIDNVTLTGWIPNKKIQKYFYAADVYIMPSDEEGFPRVLLEAMACGIPFVVSNVGGVRDILTQEQQEFMITKGDFNAFSQKLAQLLNNKQKQEQLIRIGKERVKEFDMKLVAKQYIEKIANS